MKIQLPLTLLLGLFLLPGTAAEVRLTIPNQLGHEWPGELVSFDLGKVQAPSGDLAVEVQGITRPAQIDDEGRVWSYVTISGKGEEIATVPAVLKQEKAQAGIIWKKQEGFYLIDNGTYQFKLRDYQGNTASSMPLGKFPPLVRRDENEGTGEMGRCRLVRKQRSRHRCNHRAHQQRPGLS